MPIWNGFKCGVCINDSCLLKIAQSMLLKTITWTKKSGMGCMEWKKACIEVGLSSRQLRTPVKTWFASKVLLFQETLDYA